MPHEVILRHIAVLDPGTRVPELDCFNRMSQAAPVSLSYHLPAQQGMDSVRRVERGLLGVLILGSGASVNETIPWQSELSEWLAPRLQSGLPAMGLCYGHQLLAHVLGGEVGFLTPNRAKVQGLREVPLLADRLWGPACSGPMVVSHGELVTRLPPGAALRGATDVCAVEAFASEQLPVWGIQAHPEATTAFTSNNDVPFDADPAVLAFGHSIVDKFLVWTAENA